MVYPCIYRALYVPCISVRTAYAWDIRGIYQAYTEYWGSRCKHKGSGFPMGCADLAASDGRRGSSKYEVNTWLWNFGSGKPRLGGLTASVEETAMRKETVLKDQAKPTRSQSLSKMLC